ncbi:MAG TPA: 16S rRNA (cytosine(1402)-N(4))-methyltransferase RsmH [Terriglobia bacterium]|nr:16S rRNA (cytosine(1402)-N(4))-methyltransferase RsmH [Terriglobia bacterium]
MHIPVLAAEAIEWLRIRPEGVYLDATVGAGGHAQAILERLTTGRLIAIDRDPVAVSAAREALRPYASRLTLAQQDFAELPSLLGRLGLPGVDGILVDLGISQMQLDAAERGFSFQAEGPLDMRMDPSQRLTAAEIVNRYGERELADLIYQFGEERRSKRIARAIVRARPVQNTRQLAELIAACLGGGREASRHPARREKRASWEAAARTMKRGIHPATRTFQALRIAVNQELERLEQLLRDAPVCLLPGGRIVCISFHSLEDRLVKRYFRRWQREGVLRILTPRVVRPSPEELRRNRRSRSARLRAAERLPGSPPRSAAAAD